MLINRCFCNGCGYWTWKVENLRVSSVYGINRTYDNGEGMHKFYTIFGGGIWTNNMSCAVYSNYKHNPDALRNLETLNPAMNSTTKALFSHFAVRARTNGPIRVGRRRSLTPPGFGRTSSMGHVAHRTHICPPALAFTSVAALSSLWEVRALRVLVGTLIRKPVRDCLLR